MADASDSKSDVGDYVWVQVPSPAFFMPRSLMPLHQKVKWLRNRCIRRKFDCGLLCKKGCGAWHAGSNESEFWE